MDVRYKIKVYVCKIPDKFIRKF